MNGILCAYVRDAIPRTPKVVATALRAALDGELDDVDRVEVGRVRSERGRPGMLDSLVDREDRDVAGAGEAAAVEEETEVAEHLGVAVGLTEDAVDEVGAGKDEVLLRDAGRLVVEQGVGVGAEQ